MKRIRDFSVGVYLTLAGHMLSVEIVPFRWARPAWRGPSYKPNPWRGFSCHLFGGPFHVWFTNGWSSFLAVELKFSQNPFHGGPLVKRADK